MDDGTVIGTDDEETDNEDDKEDAEVKEDKLLIPRGWVEYNVRLMDTTQPCDSWVNTTRWK